MMMKFDHLCKQLKLYITTTIYVMYMYKQTNLKEGPNITMVCDSLGRGFTMLSANVPKR